MVPFDQLQNILRTPADVTISNVDEDAKAGGLPYTFLRGGCKLEKLQQSLWKTLWKSYGWRYTCAGTNSSTSRNVWLCIAKYIYKIIPRNVVYKVHQQLNGKIDCGIIIGQNTIKQWNWKLQLHAVTRECWAKESRNKRRHNIWFHLHEAQKQAKLNYCSGICA